MLASELVLLRRITQWSTVRTMHTQCR